VRAHGAKIGSGRGSKRPNLARTPQKPPTITLDAAAARVAGWQREFLDGNLLAEPSTGRRISLASWW
jgi:hypothetical protein